jgi:GntR family transcriptional regulator
MVIDQAVAAAGTLVRENFTSLYEQIAARLQQEILDGCFEPSGKLPSEAELGARFDVSRVTVRMALGVLAQQGVIERKQGKGTYVAGKQVHHGLNALRSFHESLLMQGLQPQMRLLSNEKVQVPDALRPLFGRARHCVLLERLHLVNGKPIALARSYLAMAVDGLDREMLERQPNYTLLETLTGKAVARADIAVRAQQADRALAARLETKTAAALLVMERTSYFSDGSCCDSSLFFIRPERYSFVLSGVFRIERLA